MTRSTLGLSSSESSSTSSSMRSPSVSESSATTMSPTTTVRGAAAPTPALQQRGNTAQLIDWSGRGCCCRCRPGLQLFDGLDWPHVLRGCCGQQDAILFILKFPGLTSSLRTNGTPVVSRSRRG
ncbi:Gamma-aminobutyric acid receptor subunit alpha-4 [Frankliniella fusca]|uniref:Gamma-aminobutyric acid receptor subunit alpha-4 n=1 Tax=Frankliniella fusca TaxID=407009 RepID=A0AAE1GYV4_9NEOP|nr:Gamma-aminobutyric acid receptor subunit alpha-4 [Frankliniella fusca]